ncbi:MAG: DUF7935 family protein [Putridiphycobacter sp.]
MTNTELLIQLAKFAIPAIALFGAVYFFTNRWYEIQSQKNKLKAQDAKVKSVTDNGLKKTFFPLQIDATQRLVLFLERIAPNNMVMRMFNPGLPAKVFQQQLLESIRSEFDHNLAQQIFVSSEVWKTVVNSKEEVIKIINMAATELESNALAGDLSQNIFKITAQLQHQPTDVAIELLKLELRKQMA